MQTFNSGLFTTDTASLNDATMQKMNEKLKRTQSNAYDALERMIAEGKIQTDVVAEIGKNQQQQSDHPFITFDSNGTVKMRMDDHILQRNEIDISHNEFTLHQNAVQQIAGKFGIPGSYLKTLSGGDEWERQLAAKILNEHSYNTDRNRVLIRAVGGEVRGVLSDQYRRFDAMEIVRAFLNAVQQQGGILVDGLMTDTRIWFETMHPEPVIVPTQKNGNIALCFGAQLATSDYGAGALEVKQYLQQVVCLNEYTRDSLMRKVHLGSQLPDNIQLSQRTYKLDTQTMASAISDVTSTIFNHDHIEQEAIAIQRASEQDVDIEKQLKNLSRTQITKQEAAGIQHVINRGNPDDGVDGEGTLWKLVAGMTAYGREVDGERKRELSEIAGNLMGRV